MTGTRILTALVLIPAVIAIVLFTPTYVVAIATAIITILALREFFALGDAIGHRAYRLWTCFCASLMLFSQWLIGRHEALLFGPYAGNKLTVPRMDLYRLLPYVLESPATVFFIFLLGIAALSLWTKRPLVETLPAAGISSSALLLIGFPLSFAVRLHGIPQIGPKLLLFALTITWAADTTAYFVGRALGKHSLAPHISPKKTWEGSAGSIIGSLLVAYGFSFWIQTPLLQLFTVAIIGNIIGQMGDLLESAYKRSAGVKDSGALLPGHGGVLDRIDALILCIPTVWLYIYVSAAIGMRQWLQW